MSIDARECVDLLKGQARIAAIEVVTVGVCLRTSAGRTSLGQESLSILVRMPDELR